MKNKIIVGLKHRAGKHIKTKVVTLFVYTVIAQLIGLWILVVANPGRDVLFMFGGYEEPLLYEVVSLSPFLFMTVLFLEVFYVKSPLSKNKSQD